MWQIRTQKSKIWLIWGVESQIFQTSVFRVKPLNEHHHCHCPPPHCLSYLTALLHWAAPHQHPHPINGPKMKYMCDSGMDSIETSCQNDPVGSLSQMCLVIYCGTWWFKLSNPCQLVNYHPLIAIQSVDYVQKSGNSPHFTSHYATWSYFCESSL